MHNLGISVRFLKPFELIWELALLSDSCGVCGPNSGKNSDHKQSVVLEESGIVSMLGRGHHCTKSSYNEAGCATSSS